MSVEASPSESPLRPAPPAPPIAGDAVPGTTAPLTSPPSLPPFEAIYDEHFAFLWRSARRLGVHEPSLDDVLQETFVIVHRRLGEFEGRSTLRTWLFGVLLRVVRDHRRSQRRKSPMEKGGAEPVDPETLTATDAGPHERAAKAQAVRVLYMLLDEMDDDAREVFVLAELEQMTAPEIAEALEMNVNTVYTRLRNARLEFEKGVARHRARETHQENWRRR